MHTEKKTCDITPMYISHVHHVYVDIYMHEVILSLENFGKKLRKVHFCISIMVRKSRKDS